MSEILRMDIDGNPVSLEGLILKEPEWAATRIRRLEIQLKKLQRIAAVFNSWANTDDDTRGAKQALEAIGGVLGKPF